MTENYWIIISKNKSSERIKNTGLEAKEICGMRVETSRKFVRQMQLSVQILTLCLTGLWRFLVCIEVSGRSGLSRPWPLADSLAHDSERRGPLNKDKGSRKEGRKEWRLLSLCLRNQGYLDCIVGHLHVLI
ncbi:hypothetical protein E2C01_051430 [Portunus trituberculatus]|uniref:Uncharacterized protein n=1 Tax=Portunus trituberculatus TaxID=210409 RepID=A0A5B7GAY6_PORTR|nr:hypothetical protein [Portunus trituberculatus]